MLPGMGTTRQWRTWYWDQWASSPVGTGMGRTGGPRVDAMAASSKEEYWGTCPLLLCPTEPQLPDSCYSLTPIIPQLSPSLPILGNMLCQAGSIPHPTGTRMSSRTVPCHELLRQVEHCLGPVPPSSFHGWDRQLQFLLSHGGAWRPLDHDVSTGKPLRGSAGHGAQTAARLQP